MRDVVLGISIVTFYSLHVQMLELSLPLHLQGALSGRTKRKVSELYLLGLLINDYVFGSETIQDDPYRMRMLEGLERFVEVVKIFCEAEELLAFLGMFKVMPESLGLYLLGGRDNMVLKVVERGGSFLLDNDIALDDTIHGVYQDYLFLDLIHKVLMVDQLLHLALIDQIFYKGVLNHHLVFRDLDDDVLEVWVVDLEHDGIRRLIVLVELFDLVEPTDHFPSLHVLPPRLLKHSQDLLLELFVPMFPHLFGTEIVEAVRVLHVVYDEGLVLGDLAIQ